MNDSIRLAAAAVGNYVDDLLYVDLTDTSVDRTEHCRNLVAAVRLEEALIRGETIESAAKEDRSAAVLRTALRKLAASARAQFDKSHECHDFAHQTAAAAEALAGQV